jgi:diguanylate cyclase (GGDEF)-like protein
MPRFDSIKVLLSTLDIMLGCSSVMAMGLWIVLAWTSGPWQLTDSSLKLMLLSLVVLGGELQPIRIARGADVEEFAVSIVFTLSLVLTGPLAVAVLAQLVAVSVDDFRQHKSWRKRVFNVAQFTLTLVAARAVFCLANGRHLLADDRPFTAADLLPALIAAAVFFVCNAGMTGTVIALANGEKVLRRIAAGIRFEIGVSGVLLLLAPIVVLAVDFSLWTVPLLLLPVAAVYTSATLAIRSQHAARHDLLTGLPNRALLNEWLTRAVEADTGSGGSTAVMMIDLDHFKDINDTLGHHVGDRVLCSVAERLQLVTRKGDLVARLGGDEFVMVFVSLSGQDEARLVADRVSAALAEPILVDGVRLALQGSVGIALAPGHGDNTETLLQHADVAMYRAKEARGQYQIYNADFDRHSMARLALLGDLREGLERGEVTAYFQPQVDCATGRVIGVEALARWNHPSLGFVPPDQFIPIAESTGQIQALTSLILEESIRQGQAWRAQGIELQIAVNLSVRSLTDVSLIDNLTRCLAAHDFPAARLTLEVTESLIMADPHHAITVLSGLRALGVRLAIDDFGTGYSSLAYLKQLAVHELKIDKSFILSMLTDASDAVIVRSTVELAHNLGLLVTAEGVETVEIWEQLQRLGCDVLQGYYFGRPVSADALTDQLISATEPVPCPSPVPAAGLRTA